MIPIVRNKIPSLFCLLGLWLLLTLSPPLSAAPPRDILAQLVGPRDGVAIAAPDGRVVFAKNASRQLIPASTLKVLTAAAVLNALGSGYRFQTEFYLDRHMNLKVKGYGDPLLLSEVLSDIARALSSRIDTYRDLVLDVSYFQQPLTIPGVNPSFEPYDAPNGALCVNFNTVNFKRTSDGRYLSAEPQTPLLPFVLPRIKASALEQERIILSDRNQETTYYAGHLMRHFLSENGIASTGGVTIGRVSTNDDRLILRYASPFSLAQAVEKLLRYSNNFIANQLLISAGAQRSGPPGTLTKGVRLVTDFLARDPGLRDLTFAEGSGISRKNRLSPANMLRVLEIFEPFHALMRKKGREFYKTGNLNGISTRVGYIETDGGRRYRFAVFINTPQKTTRRVMRQIHALIADLGD